MRRIESRPAAFVAALSLVGCGTSSTGTQATEGDAGLDGTSNASDAGTAVDARTPPPDAAPGQACGSAYLSPTSTDPATPPTIDPALAGQTHHYFKITVRDGATAAPIAGAQLQTTSAIVLTSDVNGVIAFYEPGLMGQSVYFSIQHPGYEYPADFLGNRGVKLAVTEGGTVDVALQKTTGTAAAPQTDLQSRLAAAAVPGPGACTTIRVVHPKNKRGIPIVRLTAFGEDYWTDSQGIIAYCNPDHMNASVTFDVFSHGYVLPSGTTAAITTTKGGTASLALDRTDVAERLYRISGQGIYGASLLAGLETPLKHPVLNAQVMGSDTSSTTIYQGKLFWMWQDTNLLGYALGNFRGTGATSVLAQNGGLSPDLGSDTDYFAGADGIASAMSEAFDPGSDPVWMDGLVSLTNGAGVEQLFAGYAKVGSDGAAVEAGVMRFDDQKRIFTRVVDNYAGIADFQRPSGHAYTFWNGGTEYVYYPGTLRIPATTDAMVDKSLYEQFSPYGQGGASALLKNTDGTLDYAYRKGALLASSDKLKAAGATPDQILDGHAREIDSGKDLLLVGGSYAWNAHRQRFVKVAQQQFGATSFLGELWHSEADTPMGPWVYSQKIITHQEMTFYNPFHHPEFQRDNGRIIFLEGTYTASYTNAPLTPRYNYNQVMYRVDLHDPRLAMPVPVYDLGGGRPATKKDVPEGSPPLQAAFFAPDRPSQTASVAVAWSGASCAQRTLVVGAHPPTTPLFYAVPATTIPAPPSTIPLYDYADAAGHHQYSVDAALTIAGYTRGKDPIALVWENPIRVKLPVADYLGDLVTVAGDDQCVAAGAPVTLDGSKSHVRSGVITKYVWHLPGASPCEYVEGARITVSLPKGVHAIELEVVDDGGNTGVDTLIVSVT